MINMSQAAPILIMAFAYHFFHLNLFHPCGKNDLLLVTELLTLLKKMWMRRLFLLNWTNPFC